MRNLVAIVAGSPPRSVLFPYTTLFRSAEGRVAAITPAGAAHAVSSPSVRRGFSRAGAERLWRSEARAGYRIDRKSTRLNSSHTVISYAVFSLKKKNRL